jgi:hypothetical protein
MVELGDHSGSRSYDIVMTERSTPPPELVQKIDRFPASPGVYIMKDASSRVI